MQKFLDYLFTNGEGSEDDNRFKYEVGQRVEILLASHQLKRYPSWRPGFVGEIKSRRNGYPPPAFEGFWFPLYYIEGLGEVGESCLIKEA